MPIDRRAFLAAVGLTALAPAACAKPQFSIDWQDYKRRFMQPDGRVADTGNNNISHTEGQGFAMLLALEAGDRNAFASLWDWTRATLTRPDSGLFAWRYEPAKSPQVQDPNNATDGDVLMAWALLKASKAWGIEDYAVQSQTLRAAILREVCTIHAGRRVLLPGRLGFVEDDGVILNPCYYVWPALDDFAKLEPIWNDVISDGADLTAAAAFGVWALPTDWIKVDAQGLVTPAERWPARFGFDAVRVPLYLSMSGRSAELRRFHRYWRETEKPSGWPAWIDVTDGTVAPYPASDGAKAIANRVLSRPAVRPASQGDYYSESLRLLAALP